MSLSAIIKELKELEFNLNKEKLKPFILFKIDPIKDISKRNYIIRTLFGRKEKNFYKPGLIPSKGILSPNVFLVSLESHSSILELLQKEKISFKKYKIWREHD